MASTRPKKPMTKKSIDLSSNQPGLAADMAKSSRLFIASIEKGMRVLRAFDGSRRKMSLTEISALTGMDLSSAQRCTYTLCELGYLHKDPLSRNYELSVRVMDFAYHYLASNELANRAFPYLQQLSNETEETVTLMVLDDTEIVLILRLMSRYVLVRSIMVGTRLPAFCTSSGLAMLAHLPEDHVDEILKSSDLVQHTPHTVTDVEAIWKRLKNIRRDGYVITREEYYLGDISTSAAVKDYRGYAIGAVNIAVSKSRWNGEEDERRMADLAISAASVISEQ